MTQVYIDWVGATEQARHNAATEAETHRSNVAKETETVRSNREQERLAQGNLDEMIRSHKATEKIQDYSAKTQRMDAQTRQRAQQFTEYRYEDSKIWDPRSNMYFTPEQFNAVTSHRKQYFEEKKYSDAYNPDTPAGAFNVTQQFGKSVDAMVSGLLSGFRNLKIW